MAISQLIVAKIVAIVVLLVVTLLFCFLPYLLDRFYKWTKRAQGNAREFMVVLCLLNFGGGVLIATTFIHMLPEVVVLVNALQTCRMLVPTPFGLPEVLLCTGFYLMFFIEETMHFFVRRSQLKQREVSKVIVKVEVEEGEQQQPHTELTVVQEELKEPNWLRGLGIIVALSLHELFGGMAIGLEMSVDTVWFMCGAIAVHKLVLAFCIGMEIMMAHTRWIIAVIYLVVFSIVTPIGLGIGIAVSETANASAPSTASGILQSLACGTLIYVIFFEIVAKKNAGWRVYISSLVGFVLMFGVQIAIGEAQGGSHYVCP
ncbi:zinc transporter ZIP1 [Drosophila guanche]|uniref:Blast:Zinc transporter ZIP1 n=1 Tax=Drosophila guanche TaxID=7266 RepID=A0A3B0IYT5_DROGU|nr:zinc transporter ZIP1 [Drosophila guanche]SPP73027.1 blast:Zinc transporter ZIP1 [Drosophila guanche]